jgi:hypothetical protein
MEHRKWKLGQLEWWWWGRSECDRGFSEERAKIRVKISLHVEKENSAFISASKRTGTSPGKVPVTLKISAKNILTL